MEPGKSTRDEVVDKFGAPTKAFSQGGELSDGLSYQADQAIEGAIEANFFFDKRGVLFRIDVYPEREIDQATAERIYGAGHQTKRTSQGVVVFLYPDEGLTIFFHKDTGKAQVFQFTARPGPKPSGGSAWQ